MSEAAIQLPTNLISMERWGADHGRWLAAMVSRYEQPLVTFAARIVGDADLARDVVQDTFVRLGESGPWQFESGDPAKWLFKVCRNRAVDVCRRTKRLSFVDQAELEAEASPVESPAEAVARNDDAATLLRLVAELPPRQQEVIQLRFQNDLSYREIAEILGTTESNVGVTLHEAIKVLRTRRAHFQR